MIRKNINQQDLLNAVVKYEKEVRFSDFIIAHLPIGVNFIF